MHLKRKSFVAAIFACLTHPAAALEPGGIVTGAIGDQSVERAVQPEDSGYELSGDGGGTISICTVESEESASICIAFSGENLAVGPFHDVGATILPTDRDPALAYLSDAALPIAVETSQVLVSGDLMQIAGTLAAELARVDVVNGGLDTSQRLPAQLSFKVALAPSIED